MYFLVFVIYQICKSEKQKVNEEELSVLVSSFSLTSA